MQKTSIDKIFIQNIFDLEKLIGLELGIVEEYQKTIALKNSNTHFFNRSLKEVVVNYSNHGQIINIASNFIGILGLELFKQIVATYGSPDFMAKKGTVLLSKNSILENELVVNEEKGKLIACKIDENPIFVNWYKPKFEIRLTVNYQKNTTLLLIKEPNKSQQLRF